MQVATKADVKRLEQQIAELKALLIGAPTEREWMKASDWGKRMGFRTKSAISAHMQQHPGIYVIGQTMVLQNGVKHVKWRECEELLKNVPARSVGRKPKTT